MTGKTKTTEPKKGPKWSKLQRRQRLAAARKSSGFDTSIPLVRALIDNLKG